MPWVLLCLLLLTGCSGRMEGYVHLAGDHFELDGEAWWPVMLNYKAFFAERDSGVTVVPAPWYTGDDIGAHFDAIAACGFNAVRVCLDVSDSVADPTERWRATRRMVERAGRSGLRVMLLVKPPFEGYWRDYAVGLMKMMADEPSLWAWDLMNEPLYFDPAAEREKSETVAEVCRWRDLVRRHAPRHLFTVALAEPIEVFEWDPSLLPVDFVEIHTYHPLRVASEMWWYSHYSGRPWMVGETGLPADGDSVPYNMQCRFMEETLRYARSCGACGYGWWEFQDAPYGVNFEAQYTGLRDTQGAMKWDVAALLGRLLQEPVTAAASAPVNYGNMLAYDQIALVGRITDRSGHAVEGAVVRGWNDDWSVGMNTYTDADGCFRLVSNDSCVHFELSAPGYSHLKFDRRGIIPQGLSLERREREYQQIPLLGWGDGEHVLPVDATQFAAPQATEVSIGTFQIDRFNRFRRWSAKHR